MLRDSRTLSCRLYVPSGAAPMTDPSANPQRPPAPGEGPPFEPAGAGSNPITGAPAGWGLAPPPRATRSRLPGMGTVLVLILLFLAFLGGITLDRAGLLPGSPTLPGATGATRSPAATIAPAATPAPGESPRATLPPGVNGLDLIEDAWTKLHENYVDAASLDDRAMAYAAIRAMTEAVGDEAHTMFLTPEELKAMEASLSGEFVGIGVEIDTRDGLFRLADVIPGTPAEDGGLRRGDLIVAADAVPLEGLSEEEAFSRVRGPEGDPVILTIRRLGTNDFDVRLVRRSFDLELVSWTIIPGGTTALVRLESFSSGAAAELAEALTAARAAGASSLVLDLRGNPGGYVNEAISVASQFLREGVVYVTRDRDGKEEPSIVEPDGAWTDLPMVVLVDGNTASSAEIVSSALQDAGRARIVGEQTFGTGTVLARFDLADGSSLRVGTVMWLTRNGRPLWKEGLTPDITVELADDAPRFRPRDVRDLDPGEVGSVADTQLRRAIGELSAAR